MINNRICDKYLCQAIKSIFSKNLPQFLSLLLISNSCNKYQKQENMQSFEECANKQHYRKKDSTKDVEKERKNDVEPTTKKETKKLCGKDLKVNQIDELGYTPLYDAVVAEDVAEVKRLLALGANPNIWGRKRIPLNEAVWRGNKEIVILLLSHGALIVAQEISQTAIFRDAKYSKDPEIYELLIDHKEGRVRPKDENAEINRINEFGQTLLYDAIRDNDIAEVKHLLKEGANPNIYDKNNRRFMPLASAIGRGHKEIVKLLLDHDAEIVFKEDGTSDLIKDADWPEKKEILTLLLCKLASIGKKDDVLGLDPIHWACRDGHLKVVEHILETNPPININDVEPNYNFTPLHWAARRGHQSIVELLVAKGADKRAVSKNGFTPLMLAIANNHGFLKDMLAPDGFERNVKNLNEDWVCSICIEGVQDARYGGFPIIPLDCGHKFHFGCITQNVLTQYHNHINSTCPNCRAPLSNELFSHIASNDLYNCVFSVFNAVKAENIPRLKRLLARGGNVNEVMSGGTRFGLTGNSPLIEAVRLGNLEMVEILIQYGADLYYSDPGTLKTALHWICFESAKVQKEAFSPKAAAMLIKYGAMVNYQGAHSGTPLDKCYIESKEVLLEAGGVRGGSFYDIKPAFGINGRQIIYDLVFGKNKI